MAAILRKLWDGYVFLFDTLPDPRTKPWFLVAKPYQVLVVLGLYLTLVLRWGPKFMKGKPAYNLDKLLIVYNLLQVIACVYVFYYSLILAWAWHYKWICEPVDYSTSERALDIAKFTYFYYIMKVVDLIDTVFFVLRKKYNQISFLHIYHHTGMVLLTWGAATYLPGGHGTLIGVINTFVHIVMYTYYLYTVVNPSAKQSLWWKKYITQLQILQFFWCVVHMLVIVFVPDCPYPRWVSAVFLPQNLFILVLFIDFYIKNYIRKPQTQQIADQQKKRTKNLSNIIVTPSSGVGNEHGLEVSTDNEENKISQRLNNLENETSALQNEIQSPENRLGFQRTNQSQNESHGSHSGKSNHDEDGKHGKSE